MSDSVFVSDRNILLSGIIDNESVGKIMMAIKVIEDDDNKSEANLKNYKREPINLNISTKGGSVYDSLALIDVMSSCKSPIYTYAYGQIMSAGLPIFISGSKRFCGKYTRFMFHELHTVIDDYAGVIESRSNELTKVNNVLESILLSRTKINEKTLKQWHNEREVYLDAEKALKLGIVHEIL